MFSTRPSNSDNSCVTILFTDADISAVFSELLRARGIPCCTATSIDDAIDAGRLITELSVWRELPVEIQDRTLVIGSTETGTGVHLPQPITEENLERALKNFLGQCN